MEQFQSLEPTKSLTHEEVLEAFRENNIAMAKILLNNPKDSGLDSLLELNDYLSTLLSNFIYKKSNPDSSQTPLS